MRGIKELIRIIQKQNSSLKAIINRDPEKIRERTFTPPDKLYMYDGYRPPEVSGQK